ncbi:RHS repeat-associated core domain-containing protein [Pseudorhodoplanes sinuspersici]|nr:RHS repeat-associated core domain-containing protein [Pseudorhodoplanes sinuspersici]
MRVDFSDETTYTRYFHKDHLGSIATITNETGVVVERLSYDAFGKRRHPNGTDDPAGAITSQTTRSYTGHEMLSDVGLVNMNARLYDPYIGRVTTADTIVPDAANSQAWNRYSYVINNPLKYTDPTGHEFNGPGPHPLPIIDVSSGGNPFSFTYGDLFVYGFGTGCYCSGIHFGNVYGFSGGPDGSGGVYLSGNNYTTRLSSVTAASSLQNNAPHVPGVKSGKTVNNTAHSPATDAAPGGAGAAVNGNAYRYVSGGTGQALLQGTLDLVPGAHYAGLAQQEFWAGNYGSAAIYGTVSIADAALGVATLGLSTRAGAGVRAAESAASRGLSGLGGVLTSETNAVGGKVVTSVGLINQNDIAPFVNSGLYRGNVNILSGVHGEITGAMAVDVSLFRADVARFGNLPGVTVYNLPELSPGQIKNLLNGPGTTIGAFCNSGACLAPYR